MDALKLIIKTLKSKDSRFRKVRAQLRGRWIELESSRAIQMWKWKKKKTISSEVRHNLTLHESVYVCLDFVIPLYVIRVVNLCKFHFVTFCSWNVSRNLWMLRNKCQWKKKICREWWSRIMKFEKNTSIWKININHEWESKP